jgi:hypothetical protein
MESQKLPQSGDNENNSHCPGCLGQCAKKCEPWLDASGKVFDDAKLREASRDWDQETWERFLKATVDKSRAEEEVCHSGYVDLAEDQFEGTWGHFELLPWRIEREVRAAVEQLEEPCPEIIKRIFWNGETQQFIADQLFINRSKIQRMKKNSLSKIKSLLEKKRSVLGYLIRGAQSLAPSRRSPGKQIRDVYRQDLGGSYFKCRV